MPIEVRTSAGTKRFVVDMRKKPTGKNGFSSLGRFELKIGETCTVILSTNGAGGFVHADAVQMVRVRE